MKKLMSISIMLILVGLSSIYAGANSTNKDYSIVVYSYVAESSKGEVIQLDKQYKFAECKQGKLVFYDFEETTRKKEKYLLPKLDAKKNQIVLKLNTQDDLEKLLKHFEWDNRLLFVSTGYSPEVYLGFFAPEKEGKINTNLMRNISKTDRFRSSTKIGLTTKNESCGFFFCDNNLFYELFEFNDNQPSSFNGSLNPDIEKEYDLPGISRIATDFDTTSGYIEFAVGSKNALVKGIEKSMNNPVSIEKNSAVVPVEFLVNNLGGSKSIQFSNDKKSCEIKRYMQYSNRWINIKFSVGSDTINVDGEAIKLPIKTYSKNYDVFVPVGVFCKSLKAALRWRDFDKTILINRNQLYGL